MPEPKLVSSTELYADPYLKVAERRFEHEEGELRYFVKEEPEFAVVGAITEDGQIILVRQFRPGPGRFLLDLPGGMIEEGDTALETARKELLEETGYAGELESVGMVYVTAYSTAKKHMFLARNCRKVTEPEAEANMVAELCLMPLDNFLTHIRTEPVLDLDCALLLARSLGR